MTVEAIFGLQFFLSIAGWGILMAYIAAPRLRAIPLNEALFYLVAIHAFRHIGMVFQVPGVVETPLPEEFAFAASYGDLLTGITATVALVALKKNWPFAIAIVWLVNIVGTVDLANALRQPEPIPSFGAAWFIPTYLVPLLLVTHFMMFQRLISEFRVRRTAVA